MPNRTKTADGVPAVKLQFDTKFSIRLNVKGWRSVAEAHGFKSDAATAAAIGVSGACFSRVLAGQNAPSAEFMAQALYALRPIRFEQLFTPYRREVAS